MISNVCSKSAAVASGSSNSSDVMRASLPAANGSVYEMKPSFASSRSGVVASRFSI